MAMLARLAALFVVAAFMLLLATCERTPDALTQVRTLGVLRVATVNSASAYFLAAGQPKGFEYDLARGFADALGVPLQVMVEPDRAAVVKAVADGRARIGLGLGISQARQKSVRFSPPYTDIPLQAVYRNNTHDPQDVADLAGRLVLPGDTALADWLRRTDPTLGFVVDHDANSEELMAAIASGDGRKPDRVTVANADLVAMYQRYYPSLRVGFTLRNIADREAWAFPRASVAGGGSGRDDGLYDKAIAYLYQSERDGRIHQLRDRYFGHAERLGFVGGAEFARQVDARLDKWRPYFVRAARKYDLDWRLLAAIGYQESRWDQHAVSPTTVKGIMMLTKSTAERVDVDNRQNPQQSINGGARYLIDLSGRLPQAIKPPDRTWFALAAYNLGLGHVMDARNLLTRQDMNPNIWVNLRTALGWLSQKRYLSHTRYGYAQGEQAAAYVGNIRAYYDILSWMSDREHEPKPRVMDEQPSAAGADDNPAPQGPPPIHIDTPAF